MARSSGPRARDHVFGLLRTGLRDPRWTQWMTKHRRSDLATFLRALGATEPDDLLAQPAGRLDAHWHLVSHWSATVDRVARPETLPEVMEHRTRVRLHPVAPWGTASMAAVGSSMVVNAQWHTAWEVLGVAGVVAGTAWTSVALWRPRVRKQDRRFTLTGSRAVVARAEAVVADQGLLALGAGTSGIDEHLGLLVGSSRLLEQLEIEGTESGLLSPEGMLVREPQTPADHALLVELTDRRAELVHALVQLGDVGHQHRAEQREQERHAYRPGAGSRPSP